MPMGITALLDDEHLFVAAVPMTVMMPVTGLDEAQIVAKQH
jgi:hypothetical protein